MMLLAKAALGLGGTLFVAGAYTMREGVIRVDVDEYRSGGSHVHMWVPAAAVPMVMHLVPSRHMRHAAHQAREAMPILHAVVKELKKYPDAEFVQVDDGDQHVRLGREVGRPQQRQAAHHTEEEEEDHRLRGELLRRRRQLLLAR